VSVVTGSAYFAGRLGIIGALGTVLSTAIFVALVYMSRMYSEPERHVIENVAWAALITEWVLGAVTYVGLWIAIVRRMSREKAMGYTTGLYSEARVRVIDWRTGLTLREAEDKPLSTRADVAVARRHAELRVSSNERGWDADRQIE
jgi:hypothetical protein